MPWTRSRVAWAAGVLALFALLRGLRGLLEPHDRPLALGVAVAVVVVAALVPGARGGARPSTRQLGVRKAVQFLGAAGVLLLAVLLGAGVVPAGLLGVGAVLLVPLVWPAPA